MPSSSIRRRPERMALMDACREIAKNKRSSGQWLFSLENIPPATILVSMGTRMTGKCGCRKAEAGVRLSSEVGTEVVADVDIGWGNRLFIRGEACGLSWEKGVPMENVGNHLWQWKCPEKCPENFQYKLLINDHIWSLGENMTASRGTKNCVEPSF